MTRSVVAVGEAMGQMRGQEQYTWIKGEGVTLIINFEYKYTLVYYSSVYCVCTN
jgi:hypothetical protein